MLFARATLLVYINTDVGATSEVGKAAAGIRSPAWGLFLAVRLRIALLLLETFWGFLQKEKLSETPSKIITLWGKQIERYGPRAPFVWAPRFLLGRPVWQGSWEMFMLRAKWWIPIASNYSAIWNLLFLKLFERFSVFEKNERFSFCRFRLSMTCFPASPSK